MTLVDVLDAVARRWWVSVSVVLLTGVFGWPLAHPPTTYVAQAIFVVQPPATPQVPNQLDTFTPSLALTASVVAQNLKSPSGESALRARGVVGEYDVVPRNSGTVQTPYYILPSVQAIVTGHDRDTTLRSVALLMSAFDSELVALQDQLDVAQDQRITTQVIAPASASLQAPSRIRALAGAFIIGVCAAVLAPIWCDRLAGWRAGRSKVGSRHRRTGSHRPSRTRHA